MAPTRALRRAVTIPVLLLAVALAVLAVLVGMQTGATETAAHARTRVETVITETAAAAGVPVAIVGERGSGGTCTWFGLEVTPPTGKVAPELRYAGSPPVGTDPAATVETMAQHLVSAGWIVGRPAVAGLDATGPDGYRISVEIVADALAVTGDAPCVWAEGERRPLS